MIKYHGSLKADFIEFDDKLKCKTTLNILTELESIDVLLRDPDDPEFSSDIIWVDLYTALNIMKEQAKRLPHRTDFHEAQIIDRTLKFIQ